MNEVITLVYAIADNPWILFLLLLSLGVLNVFIPPIPLEAFTVLGGYLSGTGHGNSVLIWLAATIGMSIGNFLFYGWVRNNGESLLRWSFIKKQITPEYLEKARAWFQHYGVWTIYVGRFIPWMSFAVVFCCGILKISRWKFYPAIFISNLIFFGMLVAIGRYVGEQWQTFMRIWGKVTSWAGIIAVLTGIIVWIIYRHWHKRGIQLSKPHDQQHDEDHHCNQNENTPVDGLHVHKHIHQELEDPRPHTPDLNQPHQNLKKEAN